MKFNTNLAAIHAYLCADGYVIKNPTTQKHKYYHIGLRNTEEALLKDFQQRFQEEFKLKPKIAHGRCKVGSKEVYSFLTKEYSYYCHEWQMPKLNEKELKLWLKAFFDCEAWVYNKPRQNRMIGIELANEKGLHDIKKGLERLKIISGGIKKRKGRNTWAMIIGARESLERYQKEVGFLHPKKKQKPNEALQSFRTYEWEIPTEKKALKEFVKQKGKYSQKRNETRFYSIKEQNLARLQKTLQKQGIASSIVGPQKNQHGSVNFYLRARGKLYKNTKANPPHVECAQRNSQN